MLQDVEKGTQASLGRIRDSFYQKVKSEMQKREHKENVQIWVGGWGWEDREGYRGNQESDYKGNSSTHIRNRGQVRGFKPWSSNARMICQTHHAG